MFLAIPRDRPGVRCSNVEGERYASWPQ